MKTGFNYMIGFVLIRTRAISFCMSFSICRGELMPPQATTIHHDPT